MAAASPDITDVLLRLRAGDQTALEALVPAVYDDLRRLATSLLRRERPEHTLSATALVHEVYLRLIDQRRVSWQDRAHFFGAAATIMRRVLVDSARAKFAGKRGGNAPRLAIDDGVALVEGLTEEILDLDAALDELASFDRRKADVVQMKFFAGMTTTETAEVLGISDATVERDWMMARAWLVARLHPRSS